MIPLRIKVKGFMSYRDEAELSFDGAGLWMLAGRNGAGKSALFDAITYALYEQHRLGKSNHKGLINQQADALFVEFEFAVGDDIYCVKRTLSRRGNPSRQVLHIKDPNAPVSGRSGPQGVSETETQAGFDDWVRRTIGLSYETFTASVLLRQGKSDALLEASPRDRHAMLSQIIDLSRYERLHDVAETHHKQRHTEAGVYQDQLSKMEPVDEARLAELPGLIETAQTGVSAAQRRLERLAGFKVHAEHWNKLETERAEIEGALEKSQELFDQAEQIERNAARLAELNAVVPLLRAFANERERMEASTHHISELGDEATALATKLQVAAEVREEKRRVRDRLQTHKDELERQREEAQEALDGLAPDMEVIREIARLQQQIQDLEQQLEPYAPDLDDRITRLRTEVDDLTELATALPWLRQYADARMQWQGAQTREEQEHTALDRITQSIPAELVAHDITTAAAYAEHAHSEVTRLSTLLGQEEERLARLDDLEGEPACPYCRQPLAPGHIEDEQQQVRQIVRDVRAQLDQAKNTKTEAAKLKKSEDAHQEALRTARLSAEHAERQGKLTLETMPSAYRSRIEPNEDAGLGECFAQDYPKTADLITLGTCAGQLEERKQELEDAQDEAKERDRLRAQREPAAARLYELEAKYPDEPVSAKRDQHKSASDQLAAAKQGLSELAQPLKDAEVQVKAAEEAYTTTDSALRDKRAEQQKEVVRCNELRRIAAEKRTAIPANWQSECDALTGERLTMLGDEVTSLRGADERHDELVEARSQETSHRGRLQQIQHDETEIPEEARCPVATLEQQELEVRQQADEVAKGLKAVEDEKRAIDTRRAQRTDLTDKYTKAARQEHLYKELARLLGRDYLQRHLLQQAECGIVANANQVLDRISGGTLRLELRQDDAGDGEKSAGKASAKALDLVAYNSDMGTSPLPVGALSGSQRFRVSVSLALGIGYWAGQGAQRIETVIIDEGFGSLDQQGRHDMIDELHNLRSVLSRIIVVSHQEEFFNAFSQGYRIALVDGTSTVDDLETSAMERVVPDVLEPEDADMLMRESPAVARP